MFVRFYPLCTRFFMLPYAVIVFVSTCLFAHVSIKNKML